MTSSSTPTKLNAMLWHKGMISYQHHVSSFPILSPRKTEVRVYCTYTRPLSAHYPRNACNAKHITFLHAVLSNQTHGSCVAEMERAECYCFSGLTLVN